MDDGQWHSDLPNFGHSCSYPDVSMTRLSRNHWSLGRCAMVEATWKPWMFMVIHPIWNPCGYRHPYENGFKSHNVVIEIQLLTLLHIVASWLWYVATVDDVTDIPWNMNITICWKRSVTSCLYMSVPANVRFTQCHQPSQNHKCLWVLQTIPSHGRFMAGFPHEVGFFMALADLCSDCPTW